MNKHETDFQAKRIKDLTAEIVQYRNLVTKTVLQPDTDFEVNSIINNDGETRTGAENKADKIRSYQDLINGALTQIGTLIVDGVSLDF